MSAEAWDVLDLVLALLFAIGFFYYYVAGVVDRNRALSMASALAVVAFVAAAVAAAVVFLVRVLT